MYILIDNFLHIRVHVRPYILICEQLNQSQSPDGYIILFSICTYFLTSFLTFISTVILAELFTSENLDDFFAAVDKNKMSPKLSWDSI
nr:MAG TPA: hypothetical protein [Caudoviricetes sp.]